MSTDLQAVIERAWDERDAIGADTKGEVRQAVTLEQLDTCLDELFTERRRTLLLMRA